MRHKELRTYTYPIEKIVAVDCDFCGARISVEASSGVEGTVVTVTKWLGDDVEALQVDMCGDCYETKFTAFLKLHRVEIGDGSECDRADGEGTVLSGDGKT